MVKTITMTALLFLAGVGAVLWLMPYEWLWIVLPAVTLLLCAVSVALYWYEVRLPIGRMIASMQAMREGQAVTLDAARRDAIVGFIADEIQTVITTTNLGYFADDMLARARVIRIGDV